MARTQLITPLLPQNYVPVTAGALALTFASDPANGNFFQINGTEILLVKNTDTVAHTFTVVSTPDRIGRTNDLTNYSVAAGEVVALEFAVLDGWTQTDGNVYLQSAHATLVFAVARHS